MNRFFQLCSLVLCLNLTPVFAAMSEADIIKALSLPENSTGNIADAIEELLSLTNEDVQMRQRCRSQAENFPWSQTISKLNSLYLEHPVQAA